MPHNGGPTLAGCSSPVHVRILCVRKHALGLGGRFQCELGGRWNLRVRNAWQRRAG
jgi:hypothetical protein